MTDSTTRSAEHDWQAATIEAIRVQTPTVKSFVLRPGDARPFFAGQHVDVRLTAEDGYEAHRSYSICSSPHVKGTIELAIEELPTGEVSPYFHEVAQVGDVVDVRGPFTTHFAWQPDEHGEVLLLGGGSGVAPLMSMVRLHAALAEPPRMTLVYSARSWSDVIFRDELLQLRQTRTTLRVVFAITRDITEAPDGLVADFSHRLDQSAIQKLLHENGGMPNTCFVCGNNSFVGAVADALVSAGITPQNIRTERYGE